MRDASGGLTGYSFVARDIAERKRAEQSLRESAAQLRALAQHLESVREEEHAHMARVIHDELGQMLTALRLDISWLAKRVPKPSVAVERKIDEMIALTDDTIQASRRIVADLRPPILDDLGLVPAVQWYAEHLGKRAGFRIRLLTDGGEPKLDPQLAVAGYRILQEALTNVARHAQARNVEVRIGTDGATLVLEVRDDGCGVAASAASDEGAFGIAGMRERARSHGGNLEISGVAGAGTVVRVEIPIERSQAPRGPA
jgi:two-component system, NarL family, sensor histidine kinase UhpB